LLLVLITAIEGPAEPASQLVYGVAGAALLVLAALTTVTGARIPAVWLRMCPFVLSGVAALLVLASVLA
jgi:hypothetical protein